MSLVRPIIEKRNRDRKSIDNFDSIDTKIFEQVHAFQSLNMGDDLNSRVHGALKRGGNHRSVERCKYDFSMSQIQLNPASGVPQARERKLRQRIQQLEEDNRELQRLAQRDGLTGISNRRYFDLFLDKELRRAKRETTPLSLILIDIDFFKGYNDTYGHQSGDDCLKRVAGALSDAVNRPGDLVARYGGEEFGVVLANTDSPNALRLAEKLRAEVEALNVPHKASEVSTSITISVGVATTVPEWDCSPKTLITAADVALYQAKAGGRNRVMRATVADMTNS